MNISLNLTLSDRVMPTFVFWGLLSLSLLGQAAPIPGMEQNVQLTAREQPIDVFLQDLFGQAGLPVSVDPSVTGVVNGNFNALAHQVLQNITRAFGLAAYYDGVVVHVYAASHVTRRVLAVAPQVAERVMRGADEMLLTDAHNSVRTTQDGSLVVTGTPRFIEQVEELVQAARKTQAMQPPLGFKVFYLRYAWAQDVTITFAGRQLIVPGVASILRSLFTTSPQSRTQMVAQDRLRRPVLPGLRGKGLAGAGSGSDRLGLPDNDDRYPRLGADAKAQPVSYKNDTPMLPFGSPNQVRIEADPRLNAIIVRDAPERMAHYEQLIASLDIEPQSLEIEATIIDIDTDRLRELGINWRWSENNNEVLFGRGDASDLDLRPNSVITPSGRGGFASIVLGSDETFVSRINALEAVGAARVVSRPQVLTLSNVEAIFDTSSTFYVRVEGKYEVDLFNVSAGTSLRVTPHVFKDDEQVRIKLLVNIEDGTLTSDSVDQIPIVKRSTINTQALINAGESLLIGGMVRESTSEVEEKVPFLGDLPLLGMLFRSQTNRTARIERMFLISPRLAPSQRVSQAKYSRTNPPSVDQAQEPVSDNQILNDQALDNQSDEQNEEQSLVQNKTSVPSETTNGDEDRDSMLEWEEP